MCPNCTRGLDEKKEVCTVCAGTGFWNPNSQPITVDTPVIKKVSTKAKTVKVAKKKK